MADHPDIKYSPLRSDTAGLKQRHGRTAVREHEDIRYTWQPKEQIPWKAIALAFCLLLLGTLLLIISFLILTARMGGEKAQGYGFLTLGLLVFLPGFYETRIAYYSFRGRRGYSFSGIPT